MTNRTRKTKSGVEIDVTRYAPSSYRAFRT